MQLGRPRSPSRLDRYALSLQVLAMHDHLDSSSLGDLADPQSFQDLVQIGDCQPLKLLQFLKRMVTIRAAEEKIGCAVSSDQVRCPCHLVIGQEAPAVGVAASIRAGDRVFGAHRSHAHYIALRDVASALCGGSGKNDRVLKRDGRIHASDGSGERVIWHGADC